MKCRAGLTVALLIPALAGVCYEEPTAIPAARVFAFEVVDPSDRPADGSNRVQVRVALNGNARPLTKVKFEATNGLFEHSARKDVEVTADVEGVASAQLIAPRDTGYTWVQATVEGVVRRDSVRFFWARPDTLVVRANKFVVTATSKDFLEVTAELRRFDGQPAKGVVVDFEALTLGPTPQAIGVWTAATPSNADNISTARFSPGPTSYRDTLILTARVDSVVVSSSGTILERIPVAAGTSRTVVVADSASS